MDESFRTTFLFGEKAQNFLFIFGERDSRMVEFLSGLDEAADQLDKMKKGSNISTVVGSSVGVAGGVLSIAGLALAPVTAGVSLALTATGVGLGVTSGLNSVATGISEMVINYKHGNEANNLFSKFIGDVQKILDCMEDVSRIEAPEEASHGVFTAVEVGNLVLRSGAIVKGIDAAVDVTSAVKALSNEEMMVKAVNMGLQEVKAGRNIPNLAADLPDIGQLAKGTPLALSKSTRAGFIGLNAFFIGLDILFICKDSISLAKGSKNEEALLIRSRSVLWRSEVEAWKKIHDHLAKGISEFYGQWEILEKPLYP
ncbi:Apolipoprotein L3 [Bagarius yarrelli]|uniref:Apolipoprotein L3 n=1 Tax=Bagarius yarrelli TaxID=175774 RepID=A0A556VVC2_BAGYA|nr:Apolipoprotein L3 [Bagarius yarrelli]